MRAASQRQAVKPEISRFPNRELQHMPGSSTTPSCGCLRDTHPALLPSALSTASALGSLYLRGSIPGLHLPLPTLRLPPRDGPRTAWGQCGSLFLHCNGLSPSTLRRSPGAPTTTLTRIGGSPIRSQRTSASMPCKKRWPASVALRFLTPHRPRRLVHQCRVHRNPEGPPGAHQHGRSWPLAR